MQIIIWKQVSMRKHNLLHFKKTLLLRGNGNQLV